MDIAIVRLSQWWNPYDLGFSLVDRVSAVCSELGYRVVLHEVSALHDESKLVPLLQEFAKTARSVIIFIPPGYIRLVNATEMMEQSGLVTTGACQRLRELQFKVSVDTATGGVKLHELEDGVVLVYDLQNVPVGVKIPMNAQGQPGENGKWVFIGIEIPYYVELLIELIKEWLGNRLTPDSGLGVRIIAFGTPVTEEQADVIHKVCEAFKARGLRLHISTGLTGDRLVLFGKPANVVEEMLDEVYHALADYGVSLLPLGVVSVEEAIVRTLAERNQTLAVAESCSGGAIAHRITNVPGASQIFVGGVIAYSNQLKMQLLGVSRETLGQFGAVSAKTAEQMAFGVKQITSSDFGVSVTGIAGPGGGREDKPVGTVFIGIATPDFGHVQKLYSPLERRLFKQWVSQRTLELLWSVLCKCS